jgi:hypothetical protein
MGLYDAENLRDGENRSRCAAMSAKKKSSPKSGPAVAAVPSTGGSVAAGATMDPVAEPSWLDSTDPRRRRFGRIALVVLWLYVAALWLLAIDQWCNLGIFGPKTPPLP